jgi:hypothetical protein
MGTMTRGAVVAGAITVGLLTGAASASAIPRYAAPGGQTDPSLCTDPSPSAPRCTIYAAAQGVGVNSGDEVVIEPGNYTDVHSATGDLGPTGAVVPVALNVHGAPGAPRPVITLNNNETGMTVRGTLSHVEIDTAVAGTPFYLGGASYIADDIIVRSSLAASFAQACFILDGTLRDSACLATGAGARAVNDDGSGTLAPKLRNVTAVSSGGGGAIGIRFSSPSGGSTTAASVKSTIARAPGGTDVVAAQTGGGTTVVTLDHSAYATSSNQGGATSSAPGSATNQTGSPLLAADGYHELPNSAATVNLGDTDSSSGAADVDGQFRSIDHSDIGADELGHTTTTTLDCAPASLVLGSGPSSCHVLVTDVTAIPGGPQGTVTFSSSGPGSFGAPSCVLEDVGIGFQQGECTVTYTPSALGTGTHLLGGAYTPEDQLHEASQGSTPLAVTVPATPAAGGTTVKKKCKKHRKLRHGKCVKKRRK